MNGEARPRLDEVYMTHSFGWIDEEVACVSTCNGTHIENDNFIVNIDEYRECPICHKYLRLCQRNWLVDEQGNNVE